MGGWRLYAQGTGLQVRGGNTNIIARESDGIQEYNYYKPCLHDMISKLIRHNDNLTGHL
jgi:hypothetical protein